MYRTIKVSVKKEDPLYNYCDNITKLTNNLSNATLFRIRQVMTGLNKDPQSRTVNENEIISEIERALPNMGPKYSMPTAEKWFLSYYFLDSLLKTTRNPDYVTNDLPKHTAQHAIKTVVRDMKGFCTAARAYKKNPEAFSSKPKLPGYHKSGGNTTAIISNQSCVIKERDNMYVAKLPGTKLTCNLGISVPGKLKQATITPYHGIFIIVFTFDDGIKSKPVSNKPSRVCAIDVGVNNLAAITNNIGKPSLLFKGGVIKSANQWYNKKMAEMQSCQTKGTTNKFVSTPESDALCTKRNNIIEDCFLKTGKRIIDWCIANDIDTIVVGTNKGWKVESHLGRINNQNFVQIPFERLRRILQYQSERNGIRFIEQEESYTSKASFLDADVIPVYGQTEGNTIFSGKRIKRSLYRSSNGTVINADLNGSANIGRKCFPELFSNIANTSFDSVIVYKYPDIDDALANKRKQKSNYTVSKSKLRRQRKNK